MAIYDFKCKECDHVEENVIMPITHHSNDRPVCCGTLMEYYITSVPMVMWTDPIIEPFKPIATKDAPVINSMRQHREYMKRNDLVDANDLYAPPTHTEQQRAREEAKESIDAITPTAEQNEQLKRSGLDSILDD